MTDDPAGGRRRVAVAVATAVMVATAGLAWWLTSAAGRGAAAGAQTAGGAATGGVLAAADPPVAAALPTAPAGAGLDFTAEVVLDLSHVAVHDAAGRDVSAGSARLVTPARVWLPVRAGASGDITVAYHVIFADGGDSTGAYRFSVGTGVAPAALDEGARQAATEPLITHEHRIDGVSAVLLAADGLVLAGVLLLLWLRPRRRTAG